MSNKFLSHVGVCVLCLLFAAAEIRAVIIAPFPGLDELIERADAIVVLRVDEHVSPMMGLDLYSVHRCLIRQSLKGDIEGKIPNPSESSETGLLPQELEVFELVRRALDRYPGNLGMDAELEDALAVTPESEVGLLPEVHEAPLRWIHLDIEHPLSIPSYTSIPLKEGPVGGDPFAFQDGKSGAMITVFTEYSSAFEFADWIPGELNHPEVKTVVGSLLDTLEKSQFDFILRVFSSTPKRLEDSSSLREQVENLILLRIKALLFRSVRPDTLKVFQGDDRRVLLAEPTEMTVTAGEKTTFGWVVVELEGRPNVFLISGGFQTTPDPEELSELLLAIAASVRTNSPP